QHEPRLKDAAIGMGMSGHEVLFRLELPVALPLSLTGIRTAAVQVVATDTISAYVALGGLGRYIVDGQAPQDLPMMLGGSVLVVLLAVVTTLLFSWLRRLLVAPGLRAEAASGRGSCFCRRPLFGAAPRKKVEPCREDSPSRASP